MEYSRDLQTAGPDVEFWCSPEKPCPHEVLSVVHEAENCADATAARGDRGYRRLHGHPSARGQRMRKIAVLHSHAMRELSRGG